MPRSSITSRPLRLLLLAVVAIAISAFVPRRSAPLSPRFNHVMLFVSNLDTSIAFYTAAFGLQVTQRISELSVTAPDGSEVTRPARMALLKFRGQEFVLELAERAVPDAASSRHYQHLGVDVLDIASAVERVKAAGGRDFAGIRTVRVHGTVAKTAFFTGPDGESVELMQIVSGEF